MKKYKIMINWGLTLVIISMVMMSGCSSNNNAGRNLAQNTSAGTAVKQELPPYELSVLLPVSGTVQKDIGLVQDKISSITKQKINATVKITNVSYSTWTQQTNLMLASNEKVDLMWLSSNYGYNSVVSKGQVIALDSLLDKYGKDIKSVLGQEYLDICKVNGKIYGVPSTRDMAADNGTYIHKELAEKFKIDLSRIKTWNDLTDAFKIVKQSDPNVIPLAVTQNVTLVENMYNGFFDQLSDKFGVLRMKDNNLKVLNLFETPEYEENLNLMREWYLAGYLSKDAATTQDAPRELFKANKAFAYFGNFKPGVEQQEKRITGKDVVTIRFSPVTATTRNITVMMAGIPVTSKDPDRAMMLLNLWYNDNDIVNAYDNGIEGKHYEKQGDGTINYPAGVDSKTTGYSPTNYFIGNNYLSDVWKGDSLDLYAQLDKFNRSAQKSKAMGFSFNQDPVKTEVAAVTNVFSQYRKGLETGTLDPKTTLPEFNAKMKAAGLDKIIAEKQKQLDEWSKTAQ